MLSLVLMLGCSGDKDSFIPVGAQPSAEPSQEEPSEPGEPTSDPDTATEPCDLDIVSVYPEDGTAGFFYRNDISVELSAVDTSATLRLDGPEGEHPGQVLAASDSPQVVFRPSRPLLANSNYQLTISTCAGSLETWFMTSELGEPLAVDVTGNTYLFDLREGTYVKPETIGPMLGNIFLYNVMIGITSMTTNSMTIRGGMTLEDGFTQNYCNRTAENFPTVDYDGSATFSLNNATFELYVTGDSLTIYNFEMESTFIPDGTAMVETEMKGMLDMRQLDEMLTPDLETLCNLLSATGGACGPCLSDGQPYCFDIEITQMDGLVTPGSMACVLEDKCHPECDRSECSDPQSGDCTE